MGQVLRDLVSIPPNVIAPSVRQARRLLEGSYRSVDDILIAAQELEKVRRTGNGSTKGRRAQREVDLLRAALVFSSAGIDASMRRLVNDAGRVLIRASGTGAHAQYREFLKQAIPAKSVDSGLRDVLLDMEIEETILTYYLSQKTKASFQGSGDLKKRVVTVLGLPTSTLDQSIMDDLDEFFSARNEIVHQMDFTEGLGSSVARQSRDINDVVEQCNSALGVAAELVNATVSTLTKAGVR